MLTAHGAVHPGN